MIKRNFTAWDFVKQEPKKQSFTTLSGTLMIIIGIPKTLAQGPCLIPVICGEHRLDINIMEVFDDIDIPQG